MRTERCGLDESSPYKDQKHIGTSNLRNPVSLHAGGKPVEYDYAADYKNPPHSG